MKQNSCGVSSPWIPRAPSSGGGVQDEAGDVLPHPGHAPPCGPRCSAPVRPARPQRVQGVVRQTAASPATRASAPAKKEFQRVHPDYTASEHQSGRLDQKTRNADLPVIRRTSWTSPAVQHASIVFPLLNRGYNARPFFAPNLPAYRGKSATRKISPFAFNNLANYPTRC